MTPWTVASQAPLSMAFSRQEYWRGLPFPSPGDLSNPGIKPRSPALQADSLPSDPLGNPHSIRELTSGDRRRVSVTKNQDLENVSRSVLQL